MEHAMHASDSTIDSDFSADSEDTSLASSALYLSNLDPCIQQRDLKELCASFGSVENAKLMKVQDRSKGTQVGLGYIRFADRESAEAAIKALNGSMYLGQELHVNWAVQPKLHKEDTSSHFHIFVGDVGSDVTDALLHSKFSTVGECSDARVMWDHSTGRSKGYGFVSFYRKEDAEAAIEQMQGVQVGSRKIRVGWAQHKPEESEATKDFDKTDRADPSNTNVYVGNIAPETTKADLTSFFSVYGPVVEVKVHKNGGYGFVKYAMHESAVWAIVAQQKELHGRALRCSWGKNTTPPQSVATAAPPKVAHGRPLHMPAPAHGLPHSVMASVLAAGGAANVPSPASCGPQAPMQSSEGFDNSQNDIAGLLELLLVLNRLGPIVPQAELLAEFGLAGAQQPMMNTAPPVYNQGNVPQVNNVALAAQALRLTQEEMRRQAALAALGPGTGMAGLNYMDAPACNFPMDAPRMHPAAAYSGMYGLEPAAPQSTGMYGFAGGAGKATAHGYYAF